MCDKWVKWIAWWCVTKSMTEDCMCLLAEFEALAISMLAQVLDCDCGFDAQYHSQTLSVRRQAVGKPPVPILFLLP